MYLEGTPLKLAAFEEQGWFSLAVDVILGVNKTRVVSSLKFNEERTV